MTHIRGITAGRLGRRRLLGRFVFVYVLINGVAVAIAGLAAPGSSGACAAHRPCSPPTHSPLFQNQVWRSSEFGYALSYDGSALSIEQQNAAGATLKLADGNGLLIVGGSPASDGPPSAAVRREASVLSRTISGLVPDTRRDREILGSNVGFRSGSWGAYTGTFAGPEAPNQPTDVAIQAASDGKVVIMTAALDFTSSQPQKSEPYQVADTVFDTIQWAP